MTAPQVPGTDAFPARVWAAREAHGPLVLGLDPSDRLLGAWGLGASAEGLDRFADIALEAAAGTVGFVKPQAAFYERHGWRGIRTLARLVDGCRSAGLLVILDAKRGDVGSTNQAYAQAYLGLDAPIGADALTVHPYLGLGAMGPLIERAHGSGAGLLVVVRSSNPEGRALQSARRADGSTVEATLLSEIGQVNEDLAPGEIGPVGAVVAPGRPGGSSGSSGATGPGWPGDPEGGRLDLVAAHALFLAPGVGAQGASAADVARCFAACPDRVLPSASRSLLVAGPDPSRLRDAAAALSGELAGALARR